MANPQGFCRLCGTHIPLGQGQCDRYPNCNKSTELERKLVQAYNSKDDSAFEKALSEVRDLEKIK